MVKSIAAAFITLAVLTVTLCAAMPSFAADIVFGQYESNLPVVYINTASGEPVTSKTDYIAGEMRIALSGEYADNVSSYTEAFGGIEIRGRGNSTWWQDKKPYKIKLDESADLLGMGESRHWVLLANAFDGTSLRNILSYDLSGELGLIYCQSRPCELIFNGEYAGLYVLCESVRVEENRVDIYSWDDTAKDAADAAAVKYSLSKKDKKALEDAMSADLSWITTGVFGDYDIAACYDLESLDLTGGYLLELDEYYDEVSKFTTSHDVPIMVDTPEYASTNDEMMNYISSYIQSMEDAVYSPDGYNSEGKHYSEYIDMDSFIDYWIVNQTFKSVELLFKSCFMYKDTGGLLTFGPVWDMDWSSGNHANLVDSSATYNEWNHSESQDREYWYRALYDDPWFVARLQDRWWEIHDKIDACAARIASLAEYLAPAANKNIGIWGKIGGWDYAQEVDALSGWLKARVEWMDNQLSKRDPNIMKLGIESYRGITMELDGEDGAALLPETSDAAAYTTADYIAPDEQTLTVKIKMDTGNAVSSMVTRFDIYVDGIKYKSLDFSGKKLKFELPTSMLSSGGRSVVYAAGHAGESSAVYSEVYASVRIDKTITAANIAAENETAEEAQRENARRSSRLTLIILVPVAAAIIASAAVIIKKRSKNDTDSK
ncbi:MAG: CotH kinase family protein [Eubacteriales bacterium]